MKHVSQKKAVILEDHWKRQSFKCQPTLHTDAPRGYKQPRLPALLDLEICYSFFYTGNTL